ncbi:MAG: T9SS type A sorting domain-containing protein [Ignavibacteriales bacterium]|nr:T9SS type A sorting domain-containing protein [Ignavibacteriales bacterium]
MKKLFVLMVLATVVLGLMGTALQAQTLVDQWGKTARGSAWPILNTSTTPAGNGSMGGASKPSGASLSGGFNTITLNAGETIVVNGKMEFVGGDPGAAYTALRYALHFQDSASLSGRNTVDAMWTSTKSHSGYQFTPRSGGTDMANGGGGSGVIWTVANGNWNSTYSNNGGPIFSILQAPRLAVITKGVYDWGISVTALANGTNEVRFYIQKQFAAGGQSAYWTGGTGIDAGAVSRKFNFISFWTNNDIDASVTGMNLTGVTVQKGAPITVTAAPWAAFYVDNWGASRGTAWKIKNDSTYLVGDAMMSGASKPSGASLSGGFGETIPVAVGEAIIVSGSLEYVGGGAGPAYTGLRYALTFQDSMKLNNRLKDSALWVTSAPSGTTKGSYGYEFTPRSGGTDLANGSGGSGVIWTVINGNWNSTFSNGGGPIFSILQSPRLAEISMGVYNWSISVQALSNGTNEVRFYIEKQHAANQQTTYWTGGIGIDAGAVSRKFNFVHFWINNDIEAATSAFKLTNVKVDKGAPITVTAPPWQAYYVDQWGFIGGRMYGWNFIPDPDRIVGNAGIGGTAPNGKWAAIRGGFDPVTPTATKALLITGKTEFVNGGFQAPNSFRFGVFYSDAAGKVIVDSSKATLPDSSRWDGVETAHTGYLFIPPSGTNGLASWPGLSKTASSGAVVNGAWLHNDYPAAGAGILTSNYTLGTQVQTPANADAKAGIYNFAISVAATAGGADVRFKLAKADNSYAITGKLTDTNVPVATTKFNSIAFAIAGGQATTGMKLTDVKIDYVDVGTLPLVAPQGAATDVEQNTNVIPAEFGLAQNYPNPFNPSTAISYDVAKSARVSIRVYDLLGRVVAQLVDGVQSPSRYTIHWNAAGLSSGTYLYRIDAQSQDGSGTFTSVKKLMLVK